MPAFFKRMMDITNIQDIEGTPHPSAAHNTYILHYLFHTHTEREREREREREKERKKKKTVDMINGNPIPGRRHLISPNFLVKKLFHSS